MIKIIYIFLKSINLIRIKISKYIFLIFCLNTFFGCKYISEIIPNESKEIVTEEKNQHQEQNNERNQITEERNQLQEPNEERNQITEQDLKFESIF